MPDTFASALAVRIQSHERFWGDLADLQAASIRSTIPGIENHDAVNPLDGVLRRLIYSASIFAQTNIETNKELAQSIALSAILAVHGDSGLHQRTKAILADVGNFPSILFLNERYKGEEADFLSTLKLALLSSLNSIQIGDERRSLTDFQLGLWDDLPTLPIASISAPTSAGKSFLLIEYLAKKALSEGKFTAVYVAPTRALLSEVQHKLSVRMGNAQGVRISTVPSLDSERRLKQIFVLTQERLHVLLSVANLRVDLLIVDEAQNIADGTRGMILQDCLDRLLRINHQIQLFFLSPGADGLDGVARLLGVHNMQLKETNLSPVLQNRIVVRTTDGESKRLFLDLLGPKGQVAIGQLVTQRGVADPATRLAVTACELGAEGGSLVYATGPVEAEKVAAQLVADLPVVNSDALNALAKFIREHIHPEYGLAATVRHGVTFHYGRMPTLLREALEKAFRHGDLKYLVCTTTLFQGINLPARNVFISTPTRGKGVPLDPAQLWNFAGRAGRLGQDLAGNVFLIDYHKWKDQSLGARVKFDVKPAFSDTIESHYELVADAVVGTMPKANPRSPVPANVRAAAGLLLSKEASGSTSALLARISNLSEYQKQRLQNLAREALATIDLPASLLENNWTVDPYGLKRLLNRMRVKIDRGQLDELIPVHPREEGAFNRYAGIFNRTARELLGYNTRYYGAFVTTYALPWMSGQPYPVLLARWVTYHLRRTPASKVNDLIRKAFDFIEDVLRFQMVQLGKAYMDLLHIVLTERGLEGKKKESFDFSLALELGISSTSGRAFIELGMSRISALALEALFPDSELTASQARHRIGNLDVAAVGLSPIILRELRELGLLQ